MTEFHNRVINAYKMFPLNLYKTYLICNTRNEVLIPYAGEKKRPRSDCANAQSDQGFLCPFTESMITLEYIDEQGCR